MHRIMQAVPIWLHHDFYRPASWLSVALSAAGSIVAPPEDSVVVIVAVMTAAVVIAIGEVPAGIPQWTGMTAVSRRGWRRLCWSEPSLPGGLAWLCLRIMWPMLGLLSGQLLAGFGPPLSPVERVEAVTAGILAMGLAGATLAGSLVVGLAAADAATATLVTGWLAAGGAAWAQELTRPQITGVSILTVLAGWLFSVAGLLAVFCWLSSQSGEPLIGGLPRAEPSSSSGRVGRFALLSLLGVLPARSSWRRFLAALVMGVLLAGMVGWLLLMPELALRYVALALLGFGGLAIPAAALLDGRQVRRGWQRLVVMTAADPWWRCSVVLDTPTQAAVVFVGHAAIVLWPPLVVAAVAFGGSAGLAALQVAGSVAAGTGLISIGCFLAAICRVRGETTLGIGLCLLSCFLWGVGP